MARVQSVQGKCVAYKTQPLTQVPHRQALYTAFLSACSKKSYLVGRSKRSKTSSSTPLTKPLYPVARISLSGPTITAPVLVDVSLDQVATNFASSIKR